MKQNFKKRGRRGKEKNSGEEKSQSGMVSMCLQSSNSNPGEIETGEQVQPPRLHTEVKVSLS